MPVFAKRNLINIKEEEYKYYTAICSAKESCFAKIENEMAADLKEPSNINYTKQNKIK